MKKKSLFIIAAGLLITVLLCGCQTASAKATALSSTEAEETETQSEETISTSADIIEPEQLISKAEAEAILGLSVADGEKSENAVIGQKICFYDCMNDDVNGFLQISVSQDAFLSNPGSMTVESIYISTKEMFGEDLTLVEGLGDDAFLASGGYYILYKGYFISVYSGNTDKQEVIERLDEASRIAIENLDALLQ